jgi:hypothetical protein
MANSQTVNTAAVAGYSTTLQGKFGTPYAFSFIARVRNRAVDRKRVSRFSIKLQLKKT